MAPFLEEPDQMKAADSGFLFQLLKRDLPGKIRL